MISNCRGLKKKGVSTCLKNLILQYHIHFIRIQETMIEMWEDSLLSISKVVWSIVAPCIGATNRPSNLTQYCIGLIDGYQMVNYIIHCMWLKSVGPHEELKAELPSMVYTQVRMVKLWSKEQMTCSGSAKHCRRSPPTTQPRRWWMLRIFWKSNEFITKRQSTLSTPPPMIAGGCLLVTHADTLKYVLTA